MSQPKKRYRGKALNWRSLTAFIVTWAFAVAMVTGTVLYVIPKGRVAFWTDWELIGLDKGAWGNIHIIFGAIFIVSGVIHLYFNWKPFKKYLAERAAGHIHVRREVVIASIGTILVMGAAIANVPPVSWVFDLNETVKQSWVTSPDLEPPYGHAEESSLRSLTKRTDIDLDKALFQLAADGFIVNGPRDSLLKIARRNDTTPLELYRRIKKFKVKPKILPAGAYTAEAVEQQFEGKGIGRKTLTEISSMVGVEQGTVLARLASVGIEAQPDEVLRKIADRYGVTPIQVLQTILVKGFKPTRD
ncbi:MAG: DUF4405 domain-containing protein [Rhodospirillaceae bacterium]|nr:DUF4405 domain-containing protein [Rhodospirillaceae bacterium]MBT4700578.1 DUF4405 domain-containing protein [Rhodospirillaceae bacterium]MBT6361680.1 DUF4405 domain-containing protein [Rhodospirillaceae bacterium]